MYSIWYEVYIMNRFWDSIMRPIIETVNAEYIVEIGSDKGLNTKNILEYCEAYDARMTAIDPVPQFNVDEFKSRYGDRFEFFKDLSLNCLPVLDDYDVILIDGDHNWYTVYNELKIIEDKFKGKKFPLVFFHDIGWPYGRRDLYYDPENIPEKFRQPYEISGIYLDQTELKENGGLNPFLNNSIYENTPKNGVLTAVEDFVEESDLEFSLEIINAFNGLGILFSKNDKIGNVVRKVIKGAGLLDELEKDRMKLAIERTESSLENSQIKRENDSLEKELTANKNRLGSLEEQLEQTETELESSNELILVKENIIVNNGKKIGELNSILNSLEVSLIESEYSSNKGRSITQRIFSKFPSTYILLKMKETGIKNALRNIKGYKAIKDNYLFDIGFYLKKYAGVRLSGMDPLLHYIYHGFKEGKEPNSTFDGDYYLSRYSDVRNLNLNPLVHYSLYGIKEERKTHKNNSSHRVFLEDLESKFKVSIIMPTYNRASIIKRAINSVLNQSFSNYELIICDDGSTDGTEKLLKKDYARYFESGKFIYLRQEHGGVSKARNTSLKRSSGDFIAYLDTDNYWESEFLERMVGLFQDNPEYNLAYSSLQVHNLVENRHYILSNDYNRDNILKGNILDLNSFMHSREVYEELGGFDESLVRLVDWDLVLRYTKDNDPFFLDEILVQYYTKKSFNNISLQGSYEEHRDKIYDRYFDEIIDRGMSKGNFITDPFVNYLYLESKNPAITPNSLKVAVFIEGDLTNTCPYLRLGSPLEHLSQDDGFIVFVYPMAHFSKVDVDKIFKCKLFDVIIIQRGFFDNESSKIIMEKCKDNNIKVIYELDDDLLSIGKNNRMHDFFKERSEGINYLLKNSDLVTVTTNGLSERFSSMNNTSIVRNYLVDELRPMKNIKTKNNDNSIDIGYYGTLTHDDDLLMIKEPMIKIIQKCKEKYNIDVNFYILGALDQKHDESWYTKVEIPKDSTDFIPFMNWIRENFIYDIVIAPLADTVFNNAKSEIKHIEYTALGIPGIYSDLPPYNSVIQDGFNGLIAKTSKEWEEKLEKLILDENLRSSIVENSQKNIRDNYLLEHRVEEWRNILQDITQK